MENPCKEAKCRYEPARRILSDPLRSIVRVAKRLVYKVRNEIWLVSASRSYKQHNSEFAMAGALERHRDTYRLYEEQDLFNHPENRFADVLAKYPQVRGLAVDIGAGAGWLSARLSREFERVVAIEPSAAALAIAKQLFPASEHGNIEWVNGMAERKVLDVRTESPTFYVTGCVLSHLPDRVVARVCAAINKTAPDGSILALAECWGPESHEPMWHVRTQEWWQRALPGWELHFHGPAIQNVPGRHKGFHGVKVG